MKNSLNKIKLIGLISVFALVAGVPVPSHVWMNDTAHPHLCSLRAVAFAEAQVERLNREEHALLISAAPPQLQRLLAATELNEMCDIVQGWFRLSAAGDNGYKRRPLADKQMGAITASEEADAESFYSKKIELSGGHPNPRLLLEGMRLMRHKAPGAFLLADYAVDWITYDAQAQSSSTIFGMLTYNEKAYNLFMRHGPSWFAYFVANETMHSILLDFEFSSEFAGGAVGESAVNRFSLALAKTLEDHSLIEQAKRTGEREPVNRKHWGPWQEMQYKTYGYDYLPPSVSTRIKAIQQERLALTRDITAGSTGGLDLKRADQKALLISV